MILGTYRYQDRWKWFLSAFRTSLTPPGPPGKAKSLSFRTQMFTNKSEKIRKNSVSKSLITICILCTPPHGGVPARVRHQGSRTSSLAVTAIWPLDSHRADSSGPPQGSVGPSGPSPVGGGSPKKELIRKSNICPLFSVKVRVL